MATVAGTPSALSAFGSRANIITWTPLTAADPAGDVFEIGGSILDSVQFSGTWNGATAVLLGSNDNVTFFTLTDPQGNAISKTADGLEQIEENVRYIKPSTSGGGGSQSISCIVLVKKAS
jgi:hypothetical protein